MEKIKHILPLVAAAAVVGLAVWNSGLVRSQSSGSDASKLSTAEVITQSQRAFSQVPVISQPRGQPPESRAARLQRVITIESTDPQDRTLVPQLLRTFAEFEQLRYGPASSAEYAKWRTMSGYRLRSLDIMKRDWFCDQEYQQLFQEPWPAQPDPRSVFSKFYEIGMTAKDGSCRPEFVADDHRGVVVSIGRVTNARQNRPTIQGEVGSLLWYGRVAATMRNWWEPEPDRTAEAIAKRDGSLLRAELGIFTINADGRGCPRIYSFYFDPAHNQWMLEHINDNNADFSKSSALEY